MTREERNNATKNCLNCKHQDFICEVKGCKDYKKWEQADEEKLFKMRDATPEEQEAIDKYIKSISKPTGVNFWEMLKKMPAMAIPPDHDGCKDCKYETYPEYYYPCCNCKQNYVDEWQKKPHWNHGVCDNCGYDWGKDAPIASVPNFCPNCGSPMEIER